MASLDFEEALDALELFWESEVPRMGEPGATGWSHWETSDQSVAQATASDKAAPSKSSQSDPYVRWGYNELLEDRSRTLPLRSFDSQDDSDPYATILFSDIRPFLLELRSPCAWRAFRLIWLSFLGLHVPGLSATLSPRLADSSDDKWASHHLSSPAYLNAIFPPSDALVTCVTADSSAGVQIGREKEYSSPFGPVKSWTYGALEPMERAPGSHWGMWTQEDTKNVEIEVIREVFKQCRISPTEDADWDVLRVAFEAVVDVKKCVRLLLMMNHY